MPIIKIIPMPGPKGDTGATGPTGPAGSGGGISSVVPLNLYDTDEALLLSITKTNVGTTRIETHQDDLSLRSANDITLYPGSDGPGKVYIGWGDARYTPNSGNEVATIGYVDDATGASSVKYVNWQYPTEGAIAIMPKTDNEAISLKSSDSAAIRWHVRNNGLSVVSNGRLVPTSATVTPGDGVYLVTFTFPEEDAVPTATQHYYAITAPNSPGFEGNYIPTGTTLTTISFLYQTDPGVFDPNGAYIYQPSVYSQFEVDEDGAHIKIANWSDGPGGYSQSWQFTKEGAIHFPYGYSNSRTGSGDVLRFAQSFDQSIITGPVATESNQNAGRLVVAGQDGSTGNGYDGEGGDIYLWAGRGGGTNGDGGDIKIDGGNGLGTGQGGYVKIRGGNSDTGNGGFIQIESGYSNSSNQGGDISINAQQGGAVTITGNGNIDLYSTSGVYINETLVATQTYVDENKSIYGRVVASDGSPLTGNLSHVGKFLYANLTQTASEFIIPTNESVAFPIGSEIKFATSDESPWTISVADTQITTVWGESYNYTYQGASFIVPINSTATLLKIDTDRWILSGLRLTD